MKFFVALLCLVFVCPFGTKAQDRIQYSEKEYCATLPSQHHDQEMEELHNEVEKLRSRRNNEIESFILIPVQFHVFTENGGEGGLDLDQIREILERVNALYESARIYFYEISSTNFIADEKYYEYNISDESKLTKKYAIHNVLNIFIPKSVYYQSSRGNKTYYCGYTYLPPNSKDFVFSDQSCALNGSTVAHEIGHYFSMLHTHETFYGKELADGSNCNSAGDLICDTPADPRLGNHNTNDEGCYYQGSTIDPSGKKYDPNVFNIMSYAPRPCRAYFSEEQLTLMRASISLYRNNLKYATALKANFYVNKVNSCGTELEAQFYDLSIGGEVDKWFWDFGDGSTSTKKNPLHTYKEPGIYDVKLIIRRGDLSSETTIKKYISVGSLGLNEVIDFESSNTDEPHYKLFNKLKNRSFISNLAAYSGGKGLMLDGYKISSSPFFVTPESNEALIEEWNLYYKSGIKFCVDASNLDTLSLEFDMKQISLFNQAYTNCRLFINGIGVTPTYQVSGVGQWKHHIFNLNNYIGDVVEIKIVGSHKYTHDFEGISKGTCTMIDNIFVHSRGVEKDPVSGILGQKVNLNVFPNPFKEWIEVESSDQIKMIEIYNTQGVLVKKISCAERKQLLGNDLKRGIYLIKVITSQRTCLKKVMKL